MDNNKIFVLLPDGVGLRNFAFTGFHQTALENGLHIVFWNNTKFDITSLGFDEIKIQKPLPHPYTDILKRARTRIDLQNNITKSGDQIYYHYRFPLSYSNAKSTFKSLIVLALSSLHRSQNGLRKIRSAIKDRERKTAYYRECVDTLKREKPAMVFCSNQRPLTAIAPMTAAQDLGIPTAVFIFSWDNLPKATMVVEADYYFVWSSHMKKELLFYYPYIDEKRVFITGTPQYETHSDKSIIMPREFFFEKYKLEPEKKYICYSGDDVTTSPNDQIYLSDVADAIRELNKNNNNLGIVFRRCPVDLSERFDDVLKKNKDIITPIDPEWKKFGERWDAILPTPADLVLQMNTIAHTEFVINVGSSMLFDYAAHGKPCTYINYDVSNEINPRWSVRNIYKFIHFRSMPDKRAAVWLNNKKSIADAIYNMLSENRETVDEAQNWFKKINVHPATDASLRIVEAFKSIIAMRS